MRQLAYFGAGVVLLGTGFGLGYWWAHRQVSPLRRQRPLPTVRYHVLRYWKPKLDQPDPNGPGACTLYPCVTGTIRNNCDRRFISVLLVYNLYDESGVQVGHTQDSVSNLDTWEGTFRRGLPGVSENQTIQTRSGASRSGALTAARPSSAALCFYLLPPPCPRV